MIINTLETTVVYRFSSHNEYINQSKTKIEGIKYNQDGAKPKSTLINLSSVLEVHY